MTEVKTIQGRILFLQKCPSRSHWCHVMSSRSHWYHVMSKQISLMPCHVQADLTDAMSCPSRSHRYHVMSKQISLIPCHVQADLTDAMSCPSRSHWYHVMSKQISLIPCHVRADLTDTMSCPSRSHWYHVMSEQISLMPCHVEQISWMPYHVVIVSQWMLGIAIAIIVTVAEEVVSKCPYLAVLVNMIPWLSGTGKISWQWTFICISWSAPVIGVNKRNEAGQSIWCWSLDLGVVVLADDTSVSIYLPLQRLV